MGLTESKGEDIVPLGELVKQDLLGHGAMCQVFQAHWTPKNIPVALKQMMVPEVVPEDLADFRRELQLTRHHPNLVCLYGGCAEPPNLYLVMELVAHGAASDLLRTKTTDLPWPLRFRMALDTALGMRFLHSQKVMHRDLKTENLLVNSLQVDAETVVKISDLGISRFSEGNDALMTIGRGTTKWMAPEVLEGSNTYSFPVDVYSFGIILWEFYAQSAPYTEVRSVLRLPQMIIDGYRPPVPHSCPPAYSRLMQDCWHGDPSKRPSFDEVTRRLFEMKDQVCPNLVLPPAVVAIYEKGEKGGEKPLLTSPKRAKPTDAAAIAGEADSGKKQEKEKAKKEKKEKRKTKLKTKEKEDKKDKTATTTAATSSPAATAVTSPQSGSLQQRSAAGDNGSASVGSMVRRWEGGAGGSSPALSTPGAAAGRTAQQPARPPPRPAHSASMAHGVAHSRGGAAPSHSASPTSPPLARTGRAATVSGLPTPTAQAPSAVGGSAIDDNKKKTGGTFLPLGMFGGKKKMESTRN